MPPRITNAPSRWARHWTPREEKQFSDLWESGVRFHEIAAQLGRTRSGCRAKALKLGLQMNCPTGFEYLSTAAARTGFPNLDLFRKLLRSHGVVVQVAHSATPRKHWRRHFVDPIEVDAAVAAWAQTETVANAARRRGLVPKTLRSWLRAAGLKGPKKVRAKWRVTDEQVDRVVAEHRGKAA